MLSEKGPGQGTPTSRMLSLEFFKRPEIGSHYCRIRQGGGGGGDDYDCVRPSTFDTHLSGEHAPIEPKVAMYPSQLYVRGHLLVRDDADNVTRNERSDGEGHRRAVAENNDMVGEQARDRRHEVTSRVANSCHALKATWRMTKAKRAMARAKLDFCGFGFPKGFLQTKFT